MMEREPSATAMAAAAYRAAHQILEGGRIFDDPFAVPLLGEPAAALLAGRVGSEAQRGMRWFIAARSAFAENAVWDSVRARGVTQVVVLGAGLDTFGVRSAGKGVNVFEVDHPATQAWKRRRLEEAAIPIPAGLVFVPMDFERDRLADALATAGFAGTARTFYLWLGVVPYLTRSAIVATLEQMAGGPGGAEVAFDYGEPRERLTPLMRSSFEERAARVSAAGEPFLSFFAPEALHADLRTLGFLTIEDLDAAAIGARVARAGQTAAPQRRGGVHLLIASTP